MGGFQLSRGGEPVGLALHEVGAARACEHQGDGEQDRDCRHHMFAGDAAHRSGRQPGDHGVDEVGAEGELIPGCRGERRQLSLFGLKRRPAPIPRRRAVIGRLACGLGDGAGVLFVLLQPRPDFIRFRAGLAGLCCICSRAAVTASILLATFCFKSSSRSSVSVSVMSTLLASLSALRLASHARGHRSCVGGFWRHGVRSAVFLEHNRRPVRRGRLRRRRCAARVALGARGAIQCLSP